MAGEVLIHSRTEVFGDALPRTTAGALRPRLAANRRTLTVHYVGSGTFTDAGDTISEIQAIERWASSPAKGSPWEYNYVVDSEGEIWTYAGEFVAAHSAGNNTTAIGVLMLAGATDQASDAMVLGLRKLRWLLQEVGLLAPVHQLLPHRQMPGAVTQCPGPAVLARWGDIAEPWFPPSPIVDPPEVSDVTRFYRAKGCTAVYKVSGCFAVWVRSQAAVDYELPGTPGGQVVDVDRDVLAGYQLIGAGPWGEAGVTTTPADFNSWKP